MYFDFEDYRPDISPVGSAISIREGTLLSLVLHGIFVLILFFGPALPQSNRAAIVARQLALQQQREREARRFVFVAPRMDLEALKPPPRADDSDKNRIARTRERAPNPINDLPFARGNSPNRVESPPSPLARLTEPAPQRGMRDAGGGDRELNRGVAPLPDSVTALRAPAPPAVAARGNGGRAFAPGALGEALRNLQRYVQQDSFENAQGGAGVFGPSIQFDTKGVEFGPWIRAFLARIKRNWFVPYAAMSLKGHVVLTFNVQKDGTISELAILQPSAIEGFTNAAYNAMVLSNPVQPLPPEYPSNHAFFTVTFLYNETPP